MDPVTLNIVVPCFNEQAVLPEMARRLRERIVELGKEGLIGANSGVVFVDDGSRDETWSIIEQFAREGGGCSGIKLSRNVGHQNALLAGLLSTPGEVLISIDADLQDDLGAMRQMLLAHRDGADIVYGVRARRAADTTFKRLSAEGYYRLLRALGVNVVFNHADYRLMSRQAIEALREFGEVNLFLRGIVPLIGLVTRSVTYDRHPRQAGESKYPLPKMLGLAWEGITSFSVLPLRWITLTGVVLAFSSLLVGLWALYVRVFTDRYLPGWASVVVPMSFFSGIQLFSLGLLGEYLGKVYLETKRRPRFIIERTTSASTMESPGISGSEMGATIE